MAKKKKATKKPESIEEQLEQLEKSEGKELQGYDFPIQRSDLNVIAQHKEVILLKDNTNQAVYSVEYSYLDGHRFLKQLMANTD